MYHIDQVMQLATVRMEPFTHSSWIVDFPEIRIRGCPIFFMTGPLYNVMVVTPARDTNVPIALAIPRGLRRSRASILHKSVIPTDQPWMEIIIMMSRCISNLSATAIMNVKAAIVLTTAEMNVGDVYLMLAKYMFRVKLTL